MHPILIVSTGRCGSTMMSELVRLHPRMLSVSEFFVSLSSRALVGGPLNGGELCRHLTTPSAALSVLAQAGMCSGELLYRFGSQARYQPHNLPPLLWATLPFVSPQPERLLDELLAAVRGRSELPLAEQYRFILDWLAVRHGKRIWVERSGGSIRLVPTLASWFPDARFVHLCRDGRDTAASMQFHPWSRLLFRYMKGLADVGLDPFLVENAWGADPLAPFVERKMAARFSPDEFEREQVDVTAMGWLWNGMIERGLDYLGQLTPERVTTIRFEDIASSPRETLASLLRWIGTDFEDADWIESAARIPRRLGSRWTRFPQEERERLTEVCAPGLKRLGYPVV